MSCLISLATMRAAMVAADFDFADCGAVTSIPAFLTALNATYTRPSVMNVLQGTSLVQLSSDQFGTHRDGVPVAYSEKNKLRFTQEFDNAFHFKNNLTVTANAANDSDGNATADKLCESSTSNVAHYLGSYTHLGQGVLQTFSVEVRAAERTQCYIQLGAIATFFNLSSGTVISGTGGTITSLGGGLYRCSVTGAPTNTNLLLGLASSSSSTYAGTVGYGLYVSKAQLEFGNLSAYERNYDGATGKYSALIEPAATNLVLRNTDNSNAYWVYTNGSCSGSAITAPDGTSTAYPYVEAASTTSHYVGSGSITVTSGTTYTYSGFFKPNGRNVVQFTPPSSQFSGTSYINFDATSISVTASSGTSNHVMFPVGSGWFYIAFSIAATATGGDSTFRYGPQSSTTAGRAAAYAGDGTSGVCVWGGQLETGTVSTSPILTTGSTATRAVAKLIVPLWKNMLLNSNDLTQSNWAKTNLTSITGGQADPNGGTSAFLLTENSSAGNHLINPAAGITGLLSPITVEAKTNGRNLYIGTDSSFAYFNLTTGAATGATLCTTSSVDLGGGWWRCTITPTVAAPSTSVYLALTNSTPAASYTGNGTSGIYLYHPMLGNGSYVETNTSLETTGNANIPGFTSAGYTLAADWRSAAARVAGAFLCDLSDNNSSNRVYLAVSFSDASNMQVTAGSVSQASIALGGMLSSRRKMAFSCQVNNFVGAVGGLALTADTSGTMPTGLKVLNIGSAQGGTTQFNSPIFRLQLIPKVLTQAQVNGWSM